MKKISILSLFFFFCAKLCFAQKLSLSTYGGCNINYSTEQNHRLAPFSVHSAIGAQYGLGLIYKPFKKYPFTISGGAEIFHGTNEYHVSYKNFPLLTIGDESASFKINYSATSYNFNIGYIFYQKNRISAQLRVGLNAMSANPTKIKEGTELIRSASNGLLTFDYFFEQIPINAYTLVPNSRFNINYNLTQRINLFFDTGFQFGILRPLYSTRFYYSRYTKSHLSEVDAFFITSKGDAITFNVGVSYSLIK